MRRVRSSIMLAVSSPERASRTAPRYPKQVRVGTRGALVVASIALAGCDPVIEIQGTFFPAWLLCMIVGVVLTVALRPVFVRLGLEPYLGPLPLIYTCLAVLLTLGTWILFFRT